MSRNHRRPRSRSPDFRKLSLRERPPLLNRPPRCVRCRHLKLVPWQTDGENRRVDLGKPRAPSSTILVPPVPRERVVNPEREGGKAAEGASSSATREAICGMGRAAWAAKVLGDSIPSLSENRGRNRSFVTAKPLILPTAIPPRTLFFHRSQKKCEIPDSHRYRLSTATSQPHNGHLARPENYSSQDSTDQRL